jgi:hypothetical protein
VTESKIGSVEPKESIMRKLIIAIVLVVAMSNVSQAGPVVRLVKAIVHPVKTVKTTTQPVKVQPVKVTTMQAQATNCPNGKCPTQGK